MKSRSISLLLLAALLWTAGSIFPAIPLTAQTSPTADGTWLRLDSQHFTFFTNGPEGVARSTAYDLELLRYVLLQLWPDSQFDPPVPTLIYLFADERSFQTYRLGGRGPKVSAEPMKVDLIGGTAGYFVPHEHGTYAALVVDAETRPVDFVYKQYILQVLVQKLPTLPLWLRHGLAEYFSTFEVEGDEALLGLPLTAHRNALASRFGARRHIPVGEFIDLAEVPRDPSVATTFFQTSWALVHYLRSEPELSRQLGAYAARSVAEIEPERAFELSFDFDLATLEERLVAYVRRTKFNYLRVAIDRGAHPVRVTRLAAHQALYHLGDLLTHAHRDRQADARTHFLQAQQLAPGAGLGDAGLGYLAELAGDDDGARAYYEKAIAGAGDEFVVQYLYGASLVQSFGDRRPADDDEAARLARGIAALERTVELWPDFAPAWARLGYAYNLQPEATSAAVEALETAYGLVPGRFDLAFNLLLAYARIDNRPAADAIVARMDALGAQALTLQRARDILLKMDYNEAGRLVRQKRLDDAIALFARIEAESRDPRLQQQAAAQLAKFESTAQALQFSELYKTAVRQLSARQTSAAEATLDKLEALAQPGRQREETDRLRRAAAKQRQETQ
ncbi:MAG: hypothetical protein AAF657_09550 [Acidobacteriota bacterium]